MYPEDMVNPNLYYFRLKQNAPSSWQHYRLKSNKCPVQHVTTYYIVHKVEKFVLDRQRINILHVLLLWCTTVKYRRQWIRICDVLLAALTRSDRLKFDTKFNVITNGLVFILVFIFQYLNTRLLCMSRLFH